MYLHNSRPFIFGKRISVMMRSKGSLKASISPVNPSVAIVAEKPSSSSPFFMGNATRSSSSMINIRIIRCMSYKYTPPDYSTVHILAAPHAPKRPYRTQQRGSHNQKPQLQETQGANKRPPPTQTNQQEYVSQ